MQHEVLVVKRHSKEDQHSPEFQELLRSSSREARAAFDGAGLVVVAEGGEMARLDVGSESLLLLLDLGNR
jgi:hypothetical protein